MKRSHEGWQTDVGAMLAGLIFPFVGYGITQNQITYLPGDPRGEPWYDTAVLATSFIMGVILFAIGFVRLLQWLQDRGG